MLRLRPETRYFVTGMIPELVREDTLTPDERSKLSLRDLPETQSNSVMPVLGTTVVIRLLCTIQTVLKPALAFSQTWMAAILHMDLRL